MLPRPFKDLEWHKGKKHRHRRLSLLLRGVLAKAIAIFTFKEDAESVSGS